MLVVPPRCPDEWACIGPHCQCRSRRPGKTPQSVLHRLKVKGKRRNVRMAHWVPEVAGHAKSGDTYFPRGSSITHHAGIEYAARKKADLFLLGRPGEADKFRPTTRGGKSRCLLPWQLVAAFDDVDVALSSAARFVDRLAREHDALFSTEGASAGMRRVLDAMSVCFDWEHLVVKAATAAQVKEFLTVARMLMPYLRHTEWPPADQFPRVQHAWPEENVLTFQYILMCSRLRQMRRPPWWVVEGAVVERVEAGGVELWLAQRIFGPLLSGAVGPWTPQKLRLPAHPAEESLRRALTARIAMVLSSFLRPAPPARFYVSLQGLAFVGYPCRERLRPHMMRSSVSRVWRCRLEDAVPGGLVKLVLPGMAGKLAYVAEVRRKLDWSAVSAELDTNPALTRGRTPGSSHVWHAARIHNFCRPMGSPEAICERVGSHMHQQWTATRHIDSGTLMDEVLLRDAQVTCLGSSRDERIVRDVAECMHHLGRRPLVTEASKQARLRQGAAASSSGGRRRRRVGEEVEASSSDESGGGSRWLLDDWPDSAILRRALSARLEKAVPDVSESSVAAALTQSCGAHGRIQVQPLFQEDLRTSNKSRADSVKRSALQSWLESESGEAFLADKRRRRFSRPEWRGLSS